MGSAAVALPQHCRSRETGSPAPAGSGPSAGSPHRTFHIRKQPYKSRFRRRLPVPYMAIPAPGWGGAEPVCRQARARPLATEARGSPGPRKREAAARAGGTGASGSTRQTPESPPCFRGQSSPSSPPRLLSSHHSPPLCLRGGAKRPSRRLPRQPRCGVFWVLAERPRQELPAPGKEESPGFQRPAGIALLRPLPTEVCP
ncbi:unnamed protein product [Coccothraustes coccothraustes]